MEHLYLLLNLASLSIPFLFSFHPKIKFHKLWKYFFPATFIMMAFFVSWDMIFTANGIWGFNENYHSAMYWGNLPLEEWLFFICIPYACIFTLYSFKKLWPKFRFTEKATVYFYVLLQFLLCGVLLYNYDKWYTLVNFSYAVIILALAYNRQRELLNTFFPVFLVLLIPFFIVNGFLTGSWIDEPVVWYNDMENLGIRIGTIPIEDSIYALSMLLTIYMLMEQFKLKWPRKNTKDSRPS